METAFIFPGQGSQVVGMGKDVAGAFGSAAEVFAKANDIVGYDLRAICFEGPAEKLNTTTISQPGIFTVSAAILEVLRGCGTGVPPVDEHGQDGRATGMAVPQVTAGLSLGEYTALYAAGVISFEDALGLVQKRGQAMQASADATKGTMVSIIGLDEEKVNQLCAEAGEGELLAAVNFNCPGQIVISGAISACERAEKLAEKYGAIKAIRLEVAGAFHTDMMAGAADSLSSAIGNCKISDPGEIKILANISADYYKSGEKIAQGLVKQLTCPILWQKCMERLIAEGVEKFYEIGPGRVLTGLMKRINRKIRVTNVSSLEAVNELLKS
ncbi:MAG: ACP S-malonyltransferase [Planctomycetota bacterium]|nr:ACP S-malonyltransferase [Planctomycetota bacterium]